VTLVDNLQRRASSRFVLGLKAEKKSRRKELNLEKKRLI
jgi:hypothetical protein